MNPIYKFYLTVGSSSPQLAFPIWKDLSIDYTKESGQQFFRRKLNGKLTFVREDFDAINNASFGTTFKVKIQMDNGEGFADYWSGVFHKTDCDINEDDKTCIVTPEVEDEYVKILAGYENTMDMIQLAPAMNRISYWKRPVFQFYISGAKTIGCFQMGEYWEQEAEPITDYDTLHNVYKFGLLRSLHKFKVLDSGVSGIDCVYWDYTLPNTINGTDKYGWSTGYKLNIESAQHGNFYYWDLTLLDSNDNQLFTNYGEIREAQPIPTQFYMTGVGEYSGQTITVSYENIRVYGRLVNDVGPDTDPQNYELPDPDITDTSGYKYGEPLGLSGAGYTGWEGFVVFQYEFQNEPNQYGQYYEDGVAQGYYVPSYGQYHSREDCLPISRNSWGEISVWMNTTNWQRINLANNFRCKPIVLKDAYSFASVIQKAVKSLDSSLDFQLTASYSDLMTNKLGQILYITPKSNILKSEYDKPAMKAPFTFKNLMDAMKSMFQAYWFIDNGKFRIERIDFFMKGGSYTTPANVGRDLTEETVSRNGKAWAFCTNKYQFDKADLPERMEFRWMDECSTIFQGNALVMESAFVSKGSKEEVNVPEITSDINMMLISRDRFSSDGFALLSCDNNDEVINWERSTGFYIQNGLLSFDYLQREYYQYNMPCYSVEVENEDRSINVQSVRKTKRSEANFPCPNDPDILKLIKTLVGNGQFEKLSINLSSRNGKATLKYNPYE